MTAKLSTIKTAFENERMTPEEIAESQDLELVAVKAALMQCSAKYRRECGQEPEEVDRLNFSNDDLARVNEVILELALSAEDPHLRFKAATYIRDDKKGRKEIAKQVGGMQTNIFMLNEQLAKMRQVKEGIVNRALGNGRTVDV